MPFFFYFSVCFLFLPAVILLGMEASFLEVLKFRTLFLLPVASKNSILRGRVEWFSMFCDFRKPSLCCQSSIFFRSLIPKNRQDRQRMLLTRGKVFKISKLTGTLKNEHLFGNLQITFLSLKRTNLKWANVFEKINNFFWFFFTFSFY